MIDICRTVHRHMAFVVAVVLVDGSIQGGHYEVFAAIHLPSEKGDYSNMSTLFTRETITFYCCYNFYDKKVFNLRMTLPKKQQQMHQKIFL